MQPLRDTAAPTGFDNVWAIVTRPDNIAIVLLVLAVGFFTALGLRQALRNDRLLKAGRRDELLKSMQD